MAVIALSHQKSKYNTSSSIQLSKKFFFFYCYFHLSILIWSSQTNYRKIISSCVFTRYTQQHKMHVTFRSKHQRRKIIIALITRSIYVAFAFYVWLVYIRKRRRRAGWSRNVLVFFIQKQQRINDTATVLTKWKEAPRHWVMDEISWIIFPLRFALCNENRVIPVDKFV